jgi:hypothetical protein
MKDRILYTVILLFGIFSLFDVFPQQVSKSVIASGGKSMQNSSYKVNGTVGQSFIGFSSNSIQQNKNGFWYQINSLITAVEQTKGEFPDAYKLEQNYPNPFNPTTTIKYAIPNNQTSSQLGKGRTEVGFVTLNVYDILGKKVTTLINKTIQPGIYEVIFNAKDLPSGVYIYRIRAGSFIQSKKLLLMK